MLPSGPMHRLTDIESTDLDDAWRSLLSGTPGVVRLPLLSGSMAPAAVAGDTLVIQTCPAGLVRVGDVGVFWADQKLTAHRILFSWRWGTRRWLLEKGDRNRHGHWRCGSTLLGRVLGVERHGTFVSWEDSRELRRLLFLHRARLLYNLLLRP